MMKKRRPYLFAASLLVLAAMACAIPGQGTASAPAPTVDPAQLDAIVAETVAAVLQQTALAPTATQPATATIEPAAELSVTTTPLPQSSITNQADGTSFYVDEKAGFNVTIPAGWLPVRIDQLEYYDAFSLPQAADPTVQSALMDINDLDPKVYRLFIFDLQDGHLQSGFVNNVNIVWDQGSSISLKTEDDIKATAESLPSVVPGLVVKSASVSKTLSDILIGVILSEVPAKNKDGADLVLVQKQVLLNVKDGLLVFTFTTEQGIKDATLPFFDTLVESIQLGE
ncbi:MAG: hypothetical protein JNM55_20045 [Anaerolineales bacterium]|nr:hypothetical protein [Anaerolineales bacterium]